MSNEKNLSVILAENLVYYRKEKGLTQLQLAEKFNYSDKSISKWERGEGMPDVLVLKSLADFYEISVDDFFKEEKRILKNKDGANRKRLLITLLSTGLVWAVAAITFFVLMVVLPNWDRSWLVFIYALAGSGIVLVVWTSIYHKRLFFLLSLSY